MNPLVAIAASILPEILKAVVGEKSGRSGRAGLIADLVAKAVEAAAGTGEPGAARTALEADQKAAADLKIRLAEIAAEADDARRADELAARELEFRQSEARQQARMDELKTELQAEDARRAASLKTFKTRLDDVRHARAAHSALSQSHSPMAWGAPAVSVIVALGFFLILGAMIALPGLPSLNASSPVFQIINVAIGALATAFATVVSFWLGSSQGSRAKDAYAEGWRRRWPGGPDGRDAPQAPRPDGSPADAKPSRRDRQAGKSNFAASVDIVLGHEGGYVDHKRDPGGATRWGIPQATLAAWRGKKVSKAEVKRLSQDEAREIYFANYWNALGCDGLPAGVDLMVFDFGVNAGPGRAAKLLQNLAGAHADGAIGPATIEAVQRLEPADLIRRYAAARLDYCRGLSTWNTFGRGWTRRTQAVERAALAMAG